MEWKVTKRFYNEEDGYDGYNINGYFDGYRGEEEYKLETMFVNGYEASRMNEINKIFIVKLADYQTYEDPSSKVIERIGSLQERIIRYSGILSAIDGHEE